ncbi:putative membrane protein [Deinobacterium chartae]|uniref:Putative membrane protein n=1 Tax=Deinobacterium chartae TaxID=521158 RepID=A0A841HYD4_9DEIO|nr:DUF1345 domain-containing protein [Deinobacterium chartae]MBB6097664.1 putative membrane protein [Deinobacterium chartae]
MVLTRTATVGGWLVPAVTATLLTWLLLPDDLPGALQIVAAWSAFALTFLLLTWPVLLICDPARTRELARSVDPGRAIIYPLVLLASGTSLISVWLALLAVGPLEGPLEGWLTALAILATLLSWAVMGTVYALHYARLYYHSGQEGGIGFPGGRDPGYLDFVYVAFTVGMSYKVADTPLESVEVRRTVLGQAVMSYLFRIFALALLIQVLGVLAS